MEWEEEGYLLTDDPSCVDTAVTYNLLKDTYWGSLRSHEIVKSFVKTSLNFTLLHEGRQVGYARAVSDFTIFSYIADFVIDTPRRGQGLGSWMMKCITGHPGLSHTQFILQTRDAHTLYEKHGFSKSDFLMRTKVKWRE